MAEDFAKLVKEQADIVRIIGEHVRLRKAGAQNWSGLCPFHSEKSGSFSVHAIRQFFHCFGCGASGDVFTFVQRIESLSFPEAVKLVAQKTGIPLPKREFSSPAEAAEHRERARLLELHEQAAAFFEEQLRSPEGSGAREYLAGRGLTPEGIARFRIGYAPDSSSTLRQHLERLAPPEQVRSGELAKLLRHAGLFSAKEQEDGSTGPIYPRFRKRITFPISNEGGKVIAFTARALEGGDKAGPKYLNSPETPLYSKGQVLFNLDKARIAIRQLAAQPKPQDFALLVEGQMDCISVSLAGIANVLATSGTAFTEAQVRLLGRYTKRVIVNFDPDNAGTNAAEKSIALLTEEGFEVRVVTLPDGLDPDRYVREKGVPAYMAAIRSARRHSEYLLDRARELHPATAEGKIQALNYLLPHIRRMPNAISREEFAADAAHRLGIDSALIRDELRQAASGRRAALGSSGTRLTDAERELLRAASSAAGSPAFAAVAAAFEAHAHHFAGLAAERTLHLLLARPSGSEPLAAMPEGPERILLAEVLLSEGTAASPAADLRDTEAALRSLECSALEREQRALRIAIAEAERRNDEEQIGHLIVRQQQVQRALRAL